MVTQYRLTEYKGAHLVSETYCFGQPLTVLLYPLNRRIGEGPIPQTGNQSEFFCYLFSFFFILFGLFKDQTFGEFSFYQIRHFFFVFMSEHMLFLPMKVGEESRETNLYIIQQNIFILCRIMVRDAPKLVFSRGFILIFRCASPPQLFSTTLRVSKSGVYLIKLSQV